MLLPRLERVRCGHFGALSPCRHSLFNSRFAQLLFVQLEIFRLHFASPRKKPLLCFVLLRPPLGEWSTFSSLGSPFFFGELFFDYPACTLNTNPSEPIHGSALITVIHPTNGVMIRQGQLTWASQHRFPRATSSRVSKIRPPSSVPLTPHDSLSKILTTLARAHTHCCGCLDRHEKRHAIFFFCVNVSKFAALFKRESASKFF